MGVQINFLNFGTQSPSSFADSLGNAPAVPRNQFGAPADNWIPLLLGGDLPTAGPFLPSYAFGAALAGGGGFGLAISGNTFAGTTYAFAGGISPLVMYVGSKFYNASQKFVQITFNQATNANVSCGIGICNWLDLTGTGSTGTQQINHDCYLVDQGGGAAGAPGLIRFNSGANRTILNAGTGKLQQGDIIRASFDFTNPAQVTIIVTRNGTVAYTQVDNAANRMTSPAFPIISAYALNASADGQYKNFSCGVGL